MDGDGTEGQPSLDDPPRPWRLPRPTGGSLRTSHSAVVVPHRRVVAIHCLALALLRLADFRFGASSRICHSVTPFRGYRAVGPGTSLRVVWPRGPLVVVSPWTGPVPRVTDQCDSGGVTSVRPPGTPQWAPRHTRSAPGNRGVALSAAHLRCCTTVRTRIRPRPVPPRPTAPPPCGAVGVPVVSSAPAEYSKNPPGGPRSAARRWTTPVVGGTPGTQGASLVRLRSEAATGRGWTGRALRSNTLSRTSQVRS